MYFKMGVFQVTVSIGNIKPISEMKECAIDMYVFPSKGLIIWKFNTKTKRIAVVVFGMTDVIYAWAVCPDPLYTIVMLEHKDTMA